MMNKNNNSSKFSLSNYVFNPEFSSLLILIVMFIITAILQEKFFTLKSIVRNINAFAPLILLSMGAAVVIISGGIDLSAGAALSLFTCVLTTVMKKSDPITGVYALLVTFAVAILVGIVNGIGIGYLRIPPVIVTFATSYMWLGIGLFLRPTPGGESVEWFRIFYNPGMIEGISPYMKQFSSMIPPALILILIACFIWWVISKTKTGRYIYAVGSNNDSAYASGINTAKVQMQACIINSIFIFLAALFFVGQNQSGDARMGDPLTLRAIASAIVGGVALSGGKGSVYFALVGALILSFVNKIIFFANISTAYQTLVSGLIVIIAIAAPVAYTLYSKE
ncbi:MAG: ABC transporter permease [Candidatus Atribacteria bacterium]|nr:ABC transporter permease [Candidatus Atribacteria bacterium]